MATKRTTQEADTSAAADTQSGEDEPEVTPSSVSTKETDYMGLALITPGTVSKDSMGRLTTATDDYMGRALLDV